MKNPMITVKRLKKDFMLPHERHSSLKSTILNLHKRKSFERFQVLNDISFEVDEGEFFGVVGRNGSGKSTLLKLLADIYTPTSGSVKVMGNLTPFIELGVGFNPELSGRDNVYLNGAILGLTEAEIKDKYNDIVDFSELGRFMDQKLKNYSSGMQVRLAFAIAIQAHNDILLIDEVLAVGDAKFQRKCFNIFKEIKKSGKTVILVTHDMGAIQEYCDRAVLIDSGSIVEIGDISKVTSAYNRINFEEASDQVMDEKKKAKTKKVGTQHISITSVRLLANGKESNYLAPREDVELTIKLKCNKPVEGLLLGYSVADTEGRIVFGSNTKEHKINAGLLKKGDSLTFRAGFVNLLDNGTYFLSVAVKSEDRHVLYDQTDKIKVVEVAGWSGAKTTIHIDNTMEVQKK